MKQDPQKNYNHKSWIAITTLIFVLVALSFIPPQSIGGVKFRRANILADILSFEHDAASVASSQLFDEEDFKVDMGQVADQIEAEVASTEVQTLFLWDLPRPSIARLAITPDSTTLLKTLIPIEDFDTLGCGLKLFYDTLLYAQRSVRIAFMGDSFVEGDILTGDLREQLQKVYGGGGAGFAPMASPLTAFRRTVKTQSSGWSSYNIMQRRNAPTTLRENFFISGWVCQAGVGASTRWENAGQGERLDSCNTGRVFFISPRDSRVEVIVNDTIRREFSVAGDASVRQIAVTAKTIRSLTFRVISGAEGLIGYGALFEGNGVTVDNYSIRSNNGQAMFWTNPAVNAQINNMLHYDLVVLQYGLNIMQNKVRNYANYGSQIEKMVAYVRQCFPGAAVLVMGVSDRAVRTESGLTPMDAIPSMLACQRRAAKNTGAAFWSTCDAMRSQGGIERFVANGWAGKDFTHINHAGGKRVALTLFDAINAGARKVYLDRERMKPLPGVLDGVIATPSRLGTPII